MAVSNVDRVGRGLDLLVQGLEPFVARVLAPHVPGDLDWTAVLAAKDGSGGTYSPTDPQVILRVVTERLGDLGYVFNGHLSRAEQNLAGELRDVRNTWAHKGSFTADDAYRALDTMERLLRAAGAVAEADQVRALRLDVQRGAYEQETRRSTRTPATPATADAEVPAWRDVLRPHRDVQDGTFAASEFAADLYRVAEQEDALRAEYADPVEFFRRTYLTGGLRDLLTRSVARLRGEENANPVINLQDRFGGGKTHSMLAVWHLFSGRPLAAFPQEVQDHLAGTDLAGLDVRRVALVGNEIPPSGQKPKPDGTVVRTLWGELAWQLGGAEAYAMLAEADRTATNPGALLRDLLERYSPAVILVDEWVAYARQLHGRGDLAGGTFETQFTFAQALTQAVAAVPGALLLVSVPASDARLGEEQDGEAEASDLEVGGEYGREALQRLDHIVRRVAHPWEPATPDESFEIVRRRLFEEPDNQATAAINAVARRFVDFYRLHPGEFPSGVTERDYENRIRTAYPIHPELLDRLYTDWSTLERFQRTRGVLRLMSTVVHHLWERGDRSPLILPGSVPLDTAGARGEIVQYVNPRWAEIIESDVDGDNSIARRIDAERPLLGKRSVTLRVARTILVDSAPTLEAARKGVDRKRITLGTALPGDVVGNFGSALDGLVNGSSHLFRDGDRYWYDTQPSLNRMAAERARDLPEDRVTAEVVERLRAAARGSAPEFVGTIVAPESTADVPDDEGTRLVLLRPEHRHSGKDKDTGAMRYVEALVRTRGSAPRLRPNTIVALAADDQRWKDLEATVRQYLAWRSIHEEKDALDLTQQNAEQARRRTEDSSRTIEDQVLATWIWGLHAVQPDPSADWAIGQVKCDGAERRLPNRAGARLVREDALRVQLAPSALHVELTTSLRGRWNRGSLAVGELWDFFTRHPYLPRLRDRRVLTEGLKDVLFDAGWMDQGFALAEGYDEMSGDFLGLAVPLEDTTFGPVIDTTLLVRPDLAVAQRRRKEAIEAAVVHETTPGPAPAPRDGATRGTGTLPAPAPDPAPARRENVRWAGRFDLDPGADVAGRLTEIAREVVELLTSAGPEVMEISLEIRAEKDAGFDTGTVRAVTENSRTLRAAKARFEDA